MTHSREVRATLRDVLWRAAKDQSLPHGLKAQLEHMGNSAAEGIDLEAEDRDMEQGDGEDSDDDVVFEN